MNNYRNPDEIKQFNVRIVIGFASISFAIAVGFIVAYGFFNTRNNKQMTDNLTFGASMISAAAAISGAAYALQSLRHTAYTQESYRRIDITRELIMRWDESLFAAARITIREIILEDGNPSLNRSEHLQEWLKQKPSARQDVTLILNLLEQMAIFWKAGLLDEALLKEFYKPIVQQCWMVLNPYVMVRRLEENDRSLYIALEQLHDNWAQ
jgi:hypothetical protein